MTPLLSTFRAGIAAAVISGLAVAPASAASWHMTGVAPVGSQVQQVQFGHEGAPDVRRRGGRYYMRGHRVYRHRRPGYRRYGDWWVPPALFGLFVGGAIMNQQRHMSQAHVRWCYRHYRSYREWDNTYQPYHGPRRQCVSPYY